mgnify:CR=1 FL=1|jgi:hypothetical protein
MNVENAVVPNHEQMKSFSEQGPDQAIYMVNLLKYKEKAEYPDGRTTNLSGAEAYALYGEAVIGHLAKVGGRPVFSGEVTQLTLGAVEELWDDIAIAMYPNRKAMMTMMMDADFQQSSIHRTAGLEGQLNIETVASTKLALNPEMDP